MDSGVSKKLIPSYGPNLVLCPSVLLSHWLTQARQHLDLKDQVCDWTLRQGHNDAKLKHLATKLSGDDYNLVARSPTRPFFDDHRDCSRVICFSTSGSYPGQVANKLADELPPPPNSRRGFAGVKHWSYWRVGWGRIVVDEVHLEHNDTAGTINLVRSLNNDMQGEIPRKILISGTPFETSPAHMAGWISVTQDKRWTKPPAVTDYPRMRTQQQNLHHCTSEALSELGRMHESLVKVLNKQRNGQEVKEDETRQLQEHQRSMSIVVQTLWLRRTKDSTFMGHTLVFVPANYHYDCLLQYPERYHNTLRDLFTKVTRQLQTSHETQVKRSRRSGTNTRPRVTATAWLTAARRARIISSFPQLAEHSATRDLDFTQQELDNGKWLRVTRGKLYELARTDSPYEQAIMDIAGRENCPKLRVLILVLRHIWGPKQKLVIFAMGPVSALIIYWVGLNPFPA